MQLKAESLGAGKTSFESAVTLFLIGLGTERGLLPSLEEQAFEPKIVDKVLDLRNSGHRIECNHKESGDHRLSRVVTQATEVFTFENIIYNKAALNNEQDIEPKRIPLIDSRRIRR